MGGNGYKETDAANCALHWSMIQKDRDLMTTWDPAERFAHLKKRFDIYMKYALIGASGALDERAAPRLGGGVGGGKKYRNGRRNIFGSRNRGAYHGTTRTVKKQCKRIVKDLKERIDKETDAAKKSALRQKLIEIVKWCEKKWMSGDLNERA